MLYCQAMSLGQEIVNQLLREVKNKERMKARHHRKSVGSLLSLIIASGMTQEEIARELGVTQPSVSKYLNKLSTPRDATITDLVRLAKKRNIEKLPPINGWANS